MVVKRSVSTGNNARPDTGALLAEVLDGIEVTDRVFHELQHTMPLTFALVQRVRSVPSRIVLVVGANELLARSLVRLGCEVDLWHPPQGVLSDEMRRLVSRTRPIDQLLGEEGGGLYDVVLLPYVLESAAQHPVEVLRRLARRLTDRGRLIVASRHSGGLASRLRGAGGSSPLPEDALAEISLSWPTLPARRLVDRTELEAWCLSSGLELEALGFVVDRLAYPPGKALGLSAWLRAHALHATMRVVPGMRECLLATLLAQSSEQQP
jgi:hypothetical protein